MRYNSQAVAVLLALGVACTDAQAEVVSVGSGGFSVKHSLASPADADTAYRAIVEHIADWWDGDHSWSGDAANLYFDARLGGCFCEKLPDGGGVEHLRIIYLAPAREIRMQGSLGPLQPMGLQGTMTWKMEPSGTGSVLEWQYTVHGHLEGGFGGIAPAVDGVIGGQLKRLGVWLQAQPQATPD